MRQLWQEQGAAVRGGRQRAGGLHTFHILGRRFAYQPDDMRLFELTPEECPPEQIPVRVPQFALSQVQPQMLVLLPTLACNLRCRYCFEAPQNGARQPLAPAATGGAGGQSATDDAGAVMGEEVIRAALRLLPKDGQIGFFGGEPLLAWGAVRRTVELAGARRYSLTTNGTLLTRETAAFLDRHGFSLIVSVDGPAHLHDAARPQADGDGSYAAVARGLHVLAGFPQLAARTTLRGTYDGQGRHAHLLQRVRHLNDLCRRYGMRNVSVEPAELAEGCGRGGCGGRGAAAVRPSEALFEEYADLAEWLAYERGAGRRAMFHHFDVRMLRLRTRRPAPSECGAGVGYCAVTPDGTLHACHRLGCPVGNVREGIDLRLQQPWRDNRYYARSGCADCWLRNVCGGGCRSNSLLAGDIRAPRPFGCWLTQTCVQCAAYLLSRESGG